MTISRESGSAKVRLGVTGHRFLAEIGRIAQGIDAALSHVAAAFPGRQLEVISSLAEGADRLVAARVLARPGTGLVAVLPLPRDDYLADFGTPESQQEFLELLARAREVFTLPLQPTRDTAYEAAGLYLLDHCDVLLAMWDGQGAQGQGGTGGVVAEARRRGIPLAWIHAGNRRPGTTELTSLGTEQGTVTYEQFP